MKGSEFVYNYVHLLYYKCHKTKENRVENRVKPFINKYKLKGINVPSENDD